MLTDQCADQLLGEIVLQVAGSQYYEAEVRPGEKVFLEREPENSHDRQAIRVDNGRGEPIGHLPRRASRWLASLIDTGKIRLEGCVARSAAEDREENHVPLRLSVSLTGVGQEILAQWAPRSKEDALHELIRRMFLDAQNYPGGRLVLELSQALHPLTHQGLLPETELLLALLPSVAREVEAAQAISVAAELHAKLGGLALGDPIQILDLSFFPLSWPIETPSPYVLLGPALDRRDVAIEEVNREGSVPHLLVTNRGPIPVLIVEGEILIGGKQNRVVNLTVLVPAEGKLVLPVSCVEQGRWGSRGNKTWSRAAAPPSVRGSKLNSVFANRQRHGSAESDQCDVWNQVTACLASMEVRSPTESLTDGLAAASERLKACREQVLLPSHAAGVLVLRGRRLVGMDLFDSCETLKELWPRLSEAYFMDATHAAVTPSRVSRRFATWLLGKLGSHARPRPATLGLNQANPAGVAWGGA